jgi:phage recombination protein Bet
MTTQKTETAVVKKEDRFMEYVPFGAQDKIRLSINIIRRLVAVPSTSGKLPTDEDCIRFQMMCQAKRLNPFEGDCFMIGYDTKAGPKFSQITAHQVFLKRSEASKGFNGMQSGVIVKRGERDVFEDEGDFMLDGDVLLGGWAKVYKKEMDHPIYKRIKLATFNKGTNQWLTNPAGMIVKCAEADALRTAFPSLLGSMYLREEVQDAIDQPKVVTAIFKDQTTSKPVEAERLLDERPELCEMLKALCEKDDVDHATLIDLLKVSGLAGDGCNGLDDLAIDDLSGTICNWSTLVQQIKGAKV